MKGNHVPSFVIFVMIGFMLSFGLSAYTTAAHADEFRRQVKRFITEMANSISERNVVTWQSGQRLKLAIGNFTYLDSQMASPFAVYLTDEVDAALVSDNRFKVIARKELDEILKEQKLQITDIINPATAALIGKIGGVDAILVGNYGIWGAEVRISAKIILVEQGEKLSE